jgi:hypothetical protein
VDYGKKNPYGICGTNYYAWDSLFGLLAIQNEDSDLTYKEGVARECPVG